MQSSDENTALNTSFPKILSKRAIIVAALAVAGFGLSSESVFATEPDIIFGKDNLYNRRVQQVDDLTGAYAHTYPLTIPPGRNGLQPDLNLTYSSQPADESAIFGYGWSVNVPYIERINRRGSNNLYTADHFFSSLSGELTSSTATTHLPKIDNGEFLSYTLSSATGTWTVKDKKGTVFTFGSSSAARMDNASDTTMIYKWMLQEVRDTNDNYIKYEYWKDSNQIYPYKITYTGNGSTDGPFTVEFTTSTRTDYTTSYKPRFKFTTNYRINEIVVKVSGSWVRKYSLALTTGDNTRRAILDTITESGRDDGVATTTLPAIDFNYQTSSMSGETHDETRLPADLRRSILADVNADGMADIIYSIGTASNTYLSDGLRGWTTSTVYRSPVKLFDTSDVDQGYRAGDVNGDGLNDLVSHEHAWLNNGNGWTESSTWASPIAFSGAQFAELNGDGLIDIVGAGGIRINTGSGWAIGAWTSSPVSLGVGSMLADLNNDGLVDILRAYYGSSTAWLNDGSSTWVFYASFTSPVEFYATSGNPTGDMGNRVADFTGDGLPDIVGSYSYFNTGNGWASSSYQAPQPLIYSNNNLDTGTRLVDANGDGIIDFLRTYQGEYLSSAYWSSSTVGRHADLLNRITYPQGGRTDITYRGSGEYRDGSNARLNPRLPYLLDTVSRIVTSDGSATSSVENLTYANGSYYYATPFDRRLAGFGKTTKTDAASNSTKIYFHQGDTSSSTIGEYNDHWSKIGKSFRIEIVSSTGDIYAQTINRWENAALATSSYFVKLTQRIDYSYDGDSDHKDRAESYSYNDTNGNLAQKIEWGEATGTDDGTSTDTGSDKFTTTYAYASNTSAHILDLLAQETVVDQSSTTVKDTRLYYDSLAFGSTTKGNLTKEERWRSGSSWVSSTRVYDGTYGLVTRQYDPRNATTSFTYDANNLYPATTTNALNQSVSYIYDYSSGKPTRLKDANSRIYETTYDGLDRVLEERQPDPDTPSATSTKTTYTYTDTANAVSIRKTDHLTGSTSTDLYSHFDGLGRLKQTRKEAEDSNTFAVTDYSYNNIGLLEKQSSPYFASGAATSSATANSALYTNYTYDPLRRISRTSDAVGSSTTAYDQWVTTVTDPNGNSKLLQKDAYSRLTQVGELSSTTVTIVVSSSSYREISDGSVKALYHLENTTDSSGNGYDLTNNGATFTTGKLSNGADFELSESDYLAAGDIFDPTSTLSVFAWVKFESFDNEIQWLVGKDHNTQGRAFAFGVSDTASKKLYVQINGFDAARANTVLASSTWYHVGFTWDDAADTITYYLNGASDGTASQSASMPTTTASLDIGRRSYTTSESYTDGIIDEVLITTNALSSSTIAALYNAGAGKEVCTAVGCDDDTSTSTVTTSSTYSTAYEYNYLGNLTKITDTNGNVRNFTYDGLGRRLTAQDLHNASDTNYGSSTFIYDDSGNLTSKIDAANQTINYTYDLTNRVLTEDYTGAAGTEVTYAYDSCTDGVGRLCVVTKAGANKSYSYTGLGRIASETSTIDSNYNTQYSYDRQGNTTLITNPDGSQVKYLYNAAGQLEQIQRKENAGSFSDVIVDFDYSPTEKISYHEYASGPRTTNTYDASKVYRLTKKSSASSASSTTVATEITDGSINALYHMEGTSDSSGNGYNLTNIAATLFESGKLSNAAHFQNSALMRASSSAMDIDGDFTIGMWIKLQATGNNKNLIARRSASPDRREEINFEGACVVDHMELFDSEVSPTCMSTDANFTTGDWHWYVWRRTGTTLSFWKDNVQLGTASYTGTANLTSDLCLGYIGINDGGCTFNGQDEYYQDELFLATVAFSTSTRDSLYNGGAGREICLTAGCGTGGDLQNISYTYDGVGNITRIADSAASSAARHITDYTYDDLHRLTRASTTNSVTNATSAQTFTYNGIGNLIYKSDVGTSTYSTSTYANPHAPTTVSSTSYAYDNNGNVLTRGSSTFAWDYNNRMVSSTVSSTAVTYTYDHTGQRVTYRVSSATTTYPTKFYNVNGTTTVKHIFLPDGTMVATIRGTSTNAVMYVNFTDHLTGASIITNTSGTIVQTLDYDPYGTLRVSTSTNSYNEQRKFIGEEYDLDSALSYLNARYYNPAQGQFLSQDPTHLAAGDYAAIKQFTGLDLQKYLADPQGLNGYSYGRNNPAKYTDPLGLWVNNSNGSFTAEKGDTLSGLQQETGRSWKDTGFSRDPRTLQIGEKVSFSRTTSNNSLTTINSTAGALSHYYGGTGASVNLGSNIQSALQNSSDQKGRQENIVSGRTTLDKGNYRVDLTKSYFFIGSTPVDYDTTRGTKYGVTTFTGFVRDGFWDPYRKNGDGIGPKYELPGGTPYAFIPYTWVISYPNPR